MSEKDFLDFVFDKEGSDPSNRDHKFQRDRVRSLIDENEKPLALSPLFSDGGYPLIPSFDSDSSLNGCNWSDAVLLELDSNESLVGERISKIRSIIPSENPIIVKVSSQDELGILELRAAQCDVVLIDAAKETTETLQYLVEVARDYHMESIVSISRP